MNSTNYHLYICMLFRLQSVSALFKHPTDPHTSTLKRFVSIVWIMDETQVALFLHVERANMKLTFFLTHTKSCRWHYLCYTAPEWMMTAKSGVCCHVCFSIFQAWIPSVRPSIYHASIHSSIHASSHLKFNLGKRKISGKMCQMLFICKQNTDSIFTWFFQSVFSPALSLLTFIWFW